MVFPPGRVCSVSLCGRNLLVAILEATDELGLASLEIGFRSGALGSPVFHLNVVLR